MSKLRENKGKNRRRRKSAEASAVKKLVYIMLRLSMGTTNIAIHCKL